MTVKKINTTDPKFTTNAILAAIDQYKADLARHLKALLDEQVEIVLEDHDIWDNAEDVLLDAYCDYEPLTVVETYIEILNYIGYKYKVENEKGFTSTVEKQI